MKSISVSQKLQKIIICLHLSQSKPRFKDYMVHIKIKSISGERNHVELCVRFSLQRNCGAMSVGREALKFAIK